MKEHVCLRNLRLKFNPVQPHYVTGFVCSKFLTVFRDPYILMAYRNLMTRDAGGTQEPGRRWDPGTGKQVGTGNRDAGGNRELGRRWDPGTGTQVGRKIFSDLEFEFLKTEKRFSKLDNFIAFSVLCMSLL